MINLDTIGWYSTNKTSREKFLFENLKSKTCQGGEVDLLGEEDEQHGMLNVAESWGSVVSAYSDGEGERSRC